MDLHRAFLSALPLLLCAPRAPAQADDHLRDANAAASVLVLERLRARDPDAFARLRRCPERAIVLVDGRHDHTDQVLRPLGLGHRSVAPAALDREPLRGVALLILDCPGRISATAARRVEAFVAGGGTLLTTDWAVRYVLQGRFGERVRHNGQYTRDDVVRIDAVARHPLTRGVFPPGRHAAWWLENQSYPIDVCGGGVTVLFGSRDLRRKGYRADALACTFRHGRGRVVHVVSHMYLQRTEHHHDWERRAASDEAAGLDLPTASAGYRKLLDDGTLRRVKAGDLNATLSVQQFLLNIVLDALGTRPPAIEPAPRPDPRPDPRPAPDLPRALTYASIVETHLAQTPGGKDFLKVNEHLPLEVVRRQDDWVLVRTPVGREGWIPAAHIAPR